MRRKTVSLMTALILAAGGMGALQASAAEDFSEHPRFAGQGLPNLEYLGHDGWIDPQSATQNYVARAKQWTRTPTLQMVGIQVVGRETSMPNCDRIPEVPGAGRFRLWNAYALMVNPSAKPSAKERFGESQSFSVRTTGFGAMPVEAEVALVQDRQANGVVRPITVEQMVYTMCTGRGPYLVRPPGAPPSSNYFSPAKVDGGVSLVIRKIKIDGQDLNLAAGCRASGVQLTVRSAPYYTWDPSIPIEDLPDISHMDRMRTTPYYSIAAGGLLSGEISVPGFAGCRTQSGEDLSPLLTTTISGAGNTVRVRVEGAVTQEVRGPDNIWYDMCPWARNCADNLPAFPIPDEIPRN